MLHRGSIMTEARETALKAAAAAQPGTGVGITIGIGVTP